MLPNVLAQFLPKPRRPEDEMPGFYPGIPGGVQQGARVADVPPAQQPIPGRAEYPIDATQPPPEQPPATGNPAQVPFYPGQESAAPSAPVSTPSPAIYPNGVPKQPMDERLPSGETVSQAVSRVPDTPEYQTYQNNQAFYPTAGAASTTPANPNDPGETAGWGSSAGLGYKQPLPLEKETDPNTIMDRIGHGETVGKSKWWKRMLKGALDGLATGGIGGAIAGSAIEGFYPKSYQNIATRQLAASTEPKVHYLDERRKQHDAEIKAQTEQRKLEAETEGVNLTNTGKRINNTYDVVTKSPEWEVAMKVDKITPQLAELLNARAGNRIHLTAADWQKKKVDYINGKAWNINEQGEATRNTALPIDPTKVPLQTTSPITGTPVALTGNQLYSGESDVAQADAQREQTTRFKNADNSIEVAKANNAAMTKWYSDNLDLRLKAAQTVSGGMAASGEMSGLAKQMQSIATQLQDLQQRIAKESDPTAAEKLQKQADSLQEKAGKVQADFDASLGKVQGGQAVLDQINSVQIPRPNILTAPKVEAVKVGRAPTSKGGKNENIGTADAYQRALNKIKGRR